MYKNNKIVVVIPAYNEEKTIGRVLNNIPDFVDNIIVVNDGSTDKTAEVAKEMGSIVLNHRKNIGVGASFHSGLRKALELSPDIMVNIDADGQFNPKDITKLIEPIISSKAEFVTASRFLDPEQYPKMKRIKFLGNKLMSYFISKLSGQRFFDVSCGFRAYSKDALLKVNLFGEFTYTQETFLNLAVKNVSIIEIPLEVRGIREFGKSKVASNLFRYGYQTIKVILKTVRDYWPLKLSAVISLFCFMIFFALGTFFMIHRIVAGSFSPHKWAGFIAGFFLMLAIVTLAIGFILDIFTRMRLNQEEMLYYLKRLFFKDNLK